MLYNPVYNNQSSSIIMITACESCPLVDNFEKSLNQTTESRL